MQRRLKKLAFFLGFAISIPGFAGAGEGQAVPSAAAESFDIGGRSIRVPAPDGFTGVLTRYKHFARRFTGTESPELEMLAVHVPDALIPLIAKRVDPDLDLFTKVSVSRSAKAIDMTPETFAAIVASLEKNFDTYLDPNGPIVAEMIKNAGKGLDKYWKQETGTKISQPKNLGFFQKEPNLFSGMIMSNIEVMERKRTMLSSVSLLNINKRLVFVYVYKVFSTEADIVTLRDFTKKWTAAILAANK